MARYRNSVFGLKEVRLESGHMGYHVNILNPKQKKRVSGGVWESPSEASREARKYIDELGW